MSPNEQGYATVTVTALVLSLSTIALSVLNYTSAGLRSSSAVAERILLDARTEGVFNETLAGLLNGSISLRSDEPVHIVDNRETGSRTLITDEAQKVDINRAPLEEVEAVLGDVSDDRQMRLQILETITKHRDRGALMQSVNAIMAPNMDSTLTACLRARFTVFKSPAASIARSDHRLSLDGRMLRIRTETSLPEQSDRGIDAVILFTGNKTDPAWIMDWRRYTAPEPEGCT